MHKSLSYKALRDYFKTEEQLLKEENKKEQIRNEIRELITTNKINEIDHVHGTALNRAIKIKDTQIIAELLDSRLIQHSPFSF